MEKVIEDCAEKCDDVAAGSIGKVNYVPHHGVYHPKKPDKIRVAFDCSATLCRNFPESKSPPRTRSYEQFGRRSL